MSEQADAIDRLRQEIIAEIRLLRTELQTGYVTKDAGAAMREDIAEIKARLQWINRAIVSTLLFPLVVGIIVYVLVGAGHTG